MLVSASTEIAEITGLGTGFVGTALLSLVTSLARAVGCPGSRAHERLRHGRGQLAWFQRF
jgi:hypothetical protein